MTSNTMTKTKKRKTNNDLGNAIQKTKDCATRTPLKTGCELRCAGYGSILVSSSWSASAISHFTYVNEEMTET